MATTTKESDPQKFEVHGRAAGITFGPHRSPSGIFSRDAAACLALIRPAVRVTPKLTDDDLRRVVSAGIPLARNLSEAGARRIAADNIARVLGTTRNEGEDDLSLLTRLRRAVVGDNIRGVSSSLLVSWLAEHTELDVDALLEERRRTLAVVETWQREYNECKAKAQEERERMFERTGIATSDSIDWRNPPFSDFKKHWARATVTEFGCFADERGLYPTVKQEAKARIPILENAIRQRYERGETPKDLATLKADLVAKRAAALDAADRLALARRACKIDPDNMDELRAAELELAEARRDVDKARDAIRSGLCWRGAA